MQTASAQQQAPQQEGGVFSWLASLLLPKADEEHAEDKTPASDAAEHPDATLDKEAERRASSGDQEPSQRHRSHTGTTGDARLSGNFSQCSASQRGDEETGEQSTTHVVLKNLPRELRFADLVLVLQQHGCARPKNIHLLRKDGKFTGMAFLRFSSVEEAGEAVSQLHGKQVAAAAQPAVGAQAAVLAETRQCHAEFGRGRRRQSRVSGTDEEEQQHMHEMGSVGSAEQHEPEAEAGPPSREGSRRHSRSMGTGVAQEPAVDQVHPEADIKSVHPSWLQAYQSGPKPVAQLLSRTRSRSDPQRSPAVAPAPPAAAPPQRSGVVLSQHRRTQSSGQGGERGAERAIYQHPHYGGGSRKQSLEGGGNQWEAASTARFQGNGNGRRPSMGHGTGGAEGGQRPRSRSVVMFGGVAQAPPQGNWRASQQGYMQPMLYQPPSDTEEVLRQTHARTKAVKIESPTDVSPRQRKEDAKETDVVGTAVDDVALSSGSVPPKATLENVTSGISVPAVGAAQPGSRTPPSTPAATSRVTSEGAAAVVGGESRENHRREPVDDRKDAPETVVPHPPPVASVTAVDRDTGTASEALEKGTTTPPLGPIGSRRPSVQEEGKAEEQKTEEASVPTAPGAASYAEIAKKALEVEEEPPASEQPPEQPVSAAPVPPASTGDVVHAAPTRQPKGPSVEGGGFPAEYQQRRRQSMDVSKAVDA